MILIRLNQGVSHGSIFRRFGMLDEVEQFGATAMANPLTGGRLILKMFPHQDESPVETRKKFLGKDSDQLSGEKRGGILPFLRTENAVQSLDRLRGTAAMQGGEHEVARFRRLQGGAGGEGIANFPQENNIRALPQRPS